MKWNNSENQPTLLVERLLRQLKATVDLSIYGNWQNKTRATHAMQSEKTTISTILTSRHRHPTKAPMSPFLGVRPTVCQVRRADLTGPALSCNKMRQSKTDLHHVPTDSSPPPLVRTAVRCCGHGRCCVVEQCCARRGWVQPRNLFLHSHY